VLIKKHFNCVFWVTLLAPFSAWSAEQSPVVLDDMQGIGDDVSIDRFEDAIRYTQVREVEICPYINMLRLYRSSLEVE